MPSIHRLEPEYQSWKAMRARCSNPKAFGFSYYGGRGIAICERWRSYPLFLADMGPRPPGTSLDRIDVNGNHEPSNCRWVTWKAMRARGNYEPSNCRWVTSAEQGRNRRGNRLLTFGDRTLPASEWADIAGIHYGTLLSRLRRGWTIERALTARVTHKVRRLTTEAQGVARLHRHKRPAETT